MEIGKYYGFKMTPKDDTVLTGDQLKNLETHAWSNKNVLFGLIIFSSMKLFDAPCQT